MTKEQTLIKLREKAHELNCQLFEEEYSPREIEIIGYYLHRIAASYLSYFTHREYEKTFKKESVPEDEGKAEYLHL